MKKTVFLSIFLSLAFVAYQSLAANNANDNITDLENVDTNNVLKNVPCPNDWTVEKNPSVDNSLTYLYKDGTLAVNVTYIADTVGNSVELETFSRVAAEQLKCSLPVNSNLIENAYSFYCKDREVEGIIYGSTGDIVLLSISGRNAKNEYLLENFIKFLAYEADKS